MKLKFDSGQAYQLEAIASIVDIFTGQNSDQGLLSTSFQGRTQLFGMIQTERGFGNKLSLTAKNIQKNVNSIQDRNMLEHTQVMEHGMNYSIEMETATGKTYCYLRTILELSLKYGWKKFIIVVPSIAIRAGVMKNLKITKEHFSGLYNALPYEHFEYSSKNLSQVRGFAISNLIQIMVINIQSFWREKNIINTESDRMDGAAPMEFISSARPIVIIDEPQSVDSTEGSKEAVKSLNPLFILRYSATHKELYNLMYRYDPIRAFREGRVKQICVISTTAEGSANKPYVKVVSIDNKKGINAVVEIQVDTERGIKNKKFTLKGKKSYDLFELSNQKDGYQGWVVNNIWAEEGREFLDFTNGNRLGKGEEMGGLSEDLQKIQIRTTIERHLDQELLLKPRGLKVLSLFFVDKVANYRFWDDGADTARLGKFGVWFEEYYEELRKLPKYASLDLPPVTEVHNGYFAEDNKHHYKDTRGDNQTLDSTAYELIMEKKEELLDPANNLRFIFSHSALREGWDNPNVFQICSLRDMSSNRQRRQTIGRGLRIAVNKDGERVFDKGLNKLYVIANESYAEFAAGLQTEYEEEANVTFGKIPAVAFARLIGMTAEGMEAPLGPDASRKVWEALKKNGYIDADGKLTELFRPDDPAFSLELPAEYAGVKDDITEIIKSYRIDQHVKNGLPRQISLRREVITSNKDFTELWNRIKQRTAYEVKFDSKELIKKAAESMKSAAQITPTTIFIDVADLQISQAGIDTALINQNLEAIEFSGDLPDIVTFLQKETELTRSTLAQIIIQSGRMNDFLINPQAFMVMALHHIKQTLRHLLVDGIKYNKTDEEYSLQLFEEMDRTYISQLTNSYGVKKSIVDYIEFDSQVEKRFVEELEKREDVKFFIKLPSRFTIDTPVGTYNPDWAIVTTNDKLVYMVRETKSTRDFFKLRNSEVDRVRCGAGHFKEIGTDFGVVTEAREIYAPERP